MFRETVGLALLLPVNLNLAGPSVEFGSTRRARHRQQQAGAEERPLVPVDDLRPRLAAGQAEPRRDSLEMRAPDFIVDTPFDDRSSICSTVEEVTEIGS